MINLYEYKKCFKLQSERTNLNAVIVITIIQTTFVRKLCILKVNEILHASIFGRRK